MKNLKYPTIMKNGIRHITKNSEECICGETWIFNIPLFGVGIAYGRIDKSKNFKWKRLEEVTCEKCIELVKKRNEL